MFSGDMEAAVTEIGGDLRRARIARKQSIEDISRATKINASLIRAIESEAFDRLPGGLFTRGFLRAYAREVGLDSDEIVARYRAEFEPSGPAQPEPEAQPHAAESPAMRTSVDIEADTARSRQIQVLQLCIILLVVALYFAVTRKPSAPTQSEVRPAAPVVTTAKTETPVATNGTVTPEPKPDAPLTLELQPRGPCWVEVTADGKRVVGKLMDAGQRQTITVHDDAMLRVGEPGAFAFTIDGVSGRSVGEPGRPAWVRINRQNYKTFLEPQP
jgi:cytoskeletal protein RodZ